jgi:hypothetical protein
MRRTFTLLGLAAVVVGVALLAAALGVFAASRCAGTDEARSDQLAALTKQARGTTAPRAGRAHRPSWPVRIEIPSIGVDASIVPLGLNRDRTLEVPTNYADAGWWTGGPRPGERGPAVIAGHVDSRTGPAVFFRLRQLRPDATIIIDRRDGTRAHFKVLGGEQYPKARFPTARVYGSTPGPTLRLITCSGAFDRSSGHYLDNTVVYADAA